MRSVERWALWLTSACLYTAPAFADVASVADNRITPSFSTPLVVNSAEASPPEPSAAAIDDLGQTAGASRPSWCAATAAPGCPGIERIDWQLVEASGAEPADAATGPIDHHLRLSLVEAPPRAGAVGPQDLSSITADQAAPRRWTDHAWSETARYHGFWQQSGRIIPELAIAGLYFSAQSGKKLFHPTSGFKFQSEGWFGKNTGNVGVDKLAHAYNTYLLAEILHMRLHRKTDASPGDAVTAAIWAWTFMALNEISDGIEPDHGYSLEDVTMNTVGALFSVLRNTVPGLKEKLSYKIEIVPNHGLYHAQGKEHWDQMRFMLSLKGSGFSQLNNTPLRFIDFQLGYYATDFQLEDRAKGIIPGRHLFVGLGLNVGELLFGRSHSRLGRAGYNVLDYFQIPYTSARVDTGIM